MGEDRCTRQLAQPRGASRMISMRMRDDDEPNVSEREPMRFQDLPDLVLRGRNAGVDENAPLLAANDMGIDDAERQDRHANDSG